MAPGDPEPNNRETPKGGRQGKGALPETRAAENGEKRGKLGYTPVAKPTETWAFMGSKKSQDGSPPSVQHQPGPPQG